MPLVPTFSPAGWVGNVLEKVDYMLAYFFETQKSQSHFHKNTVTSFQAIIADNSAVGQLGPALELVLTDYLRSQFDQVQLSVSVDGAFNDPDNSELTITIGCSFSANGIPYTISHAIDVLGTQVKRIIRLNETGSTT